MYNVNNKDTRTTLERHTFRGVSGVLPETLRNLCLSGVVLVSLLLTLNNYTPCSSVSIVNFEQVNADWESNKQKSLRKIAKFHLISGYGNFKETHNFF